MFSHWSICTLHCHCLPNNLSAVSLLIFHWFSASKLKSHLCRNSFPKPSKPSPSKRSASQRNLSSSSAPPFLVYLENLNRIFPWPFLDNPLTWLRAREYSDALRLDLQTVELKNFWVYVYGFERLFTGLQSAFVHIHEGFPRPGPRIDLSRQHSLPRDDCSAWMGLNESMTSPRKDQYPQNRCELLSISYQIIRGRAASFVHRRQIFPF